MSIHSGHRQRVRNRFLEEGLDHFDDYVVLEMALFYCFPQIDTNPIAHRLINTFGSFPQVLEAPVEELTKVEGIGANAATFLSFLGALCRFYYVEKSKPTKRMKSSEDFARYIAPHFLGRRNEMVYLMCLDAKYHLLCCRMLSEGNVNNTAVSVRKIIEIALGMGASYVVLAHNHPKGYAIASYEDVQTTIELQNSLSAVGIALLDHIVIADNNYASIVYKKQTGKCIDTDENGKESE